MQLEGSCPAGGTPMAVMASPGTTLLAAVSSATRVDASLLQISIYYHCVPTLRVFIGDTWLTEP